MSESTIPAETLFARLGGDAAIAAAVTEFYKRVLTDTELAPFFLTVNMDIQRRKQIEFLTTALGGPNVYKGPSMRKAHSGLGITADHFARVATHLHATLEHLGVPAPLVHEVMGAVAPLRDEIVGAPLV